MGRTLDGWGAVAVPVDGFTLSFLARELAEVLEGGRVERVAQPERDAVLLTVRSRGENHRLLLSANPNAPRAQLTAQPYENPAEPPMFCMLLRKHLQGARLNTLRQPEGDRVLRIALDCLGEMGDATQKTLVLELMGRYSNLTFVDENNCIIDCIRHVNSDMSRVRVLLPGAAFTPPPPQNKLNPAAFTAEQLARPLSAATGTLHKALADSVAGLAGGSAREVCAQAGLAADLPCAQLDAPAAAEAVARFYAQLAQRAAPVLLTDETGLALDFFAFPYRTYGAALQKGYPSLSAAMDAFYLGRDLRMRMQQKSAGLQRHIRNNLARLEKKQAAMLDTLAESGKAEQYRIFGELLTANLHQLPKGAAEAQVPDYYTEGQPLIRIPLQTQLTPAKNAQAYYKKYRKLKGAEQYAREQLAGLASELQTLEGALDDLENCATAADLSDIRQLMTDSGFLRPDPASRKRKKPVEGKPYRFTAPDGVEVYVGKNAVQNDRLTLRAGGEETWLHAQGVAGSHVLVRGESEPSADTLLFAARLAVYFSKGRNHPSQPVDYVKRKHIRKAAGAAPGFVTYAGHQTLYVGLTPEQCVTIARESAKA